MNIHIIEYVEPWRIQILSGSFSNGLLVILKWCVHKQRLTNIAQVRLFWLRLCSINSIWWCWPYHSTDIIRYLILNLVWVRLCQDGSVRTHFLIGWLRLIFIANQQFLLFLLFLIRGMRKTTSILRRLSLLLLVLYHF